MYMLLAAKSLLCNEQNIYLVLL